MEYIGGKAADLLDFSYANVRFIFAWEQYFSPPVYWKFIGKKKDNH